MKKVWKKRSATNVIDSHKEYLNDIPRIASPNYRPTTLDVIIARIRSTQVVQERYRIDGENITCCTILDQCRILDISH